MSDPRPILWEWLGSVEYIEAMDLMRRSSEMVKLSDETSGVLLFLEHPPVVTLGRRAGPEDLAVNEEQLWERGIGLYRTGRGGRATCHGPGQLVGYAVLDLDKLGVGVRGLVEGVERAIAGALIEWGVHNPGPGPGPGVWVSGKKIASIGMQVDRRITSHGFAINLDFDLATYDCIIPCGMKDMRVANASEYIDPVPSPGAAAETVAYFFGKIFSMNILRSCKLKSFLKNCSYSVSINGDPKEGEAA